VTIDPTAIDINFDPTKQIMDGYTRIGNAHFRVPFISELSYNLWQGGCRNGLALPPFVRHLVSLYPWERYDVHDDLHSMLSVVMYDSEEQSFDQVDGIAAWVNECRKDGVTLVHCQAGLNRSSLVAARVLMLEGMSADEAIKLIREKRSPACLINPSFEAWLRAR
jgi:protein-tyrosine phosphatase